jgi:hypothetical protein
MFQLSLKNMLRQLLGLDLNVILISLEVRYVRHGLG